MSRSLSSIPEIVDEARNGHMFILVDDERRENEGDLVVPAQFATPQAINFMARHARGLICLAMTRQRLLQLGLPLIAQSNDRGLQTAFTLSIEARSGITTGISAHDRAHTVAVAINPESHREDIVTPGHVFPLMAREGGTLVRAGHTEAGVDISRLAGLNPAGVICEIMKDDGTMARLPDLFEFAGRHGLKIGAIADLIAYRQRTEQLIARTEEAVVRHDHGGEWKLIVYKGILDEAEHMALIKGEVSTDEPVLVRIHGGDTVDELLGRTHTIALHRAMDIIAEAGRGAVILVRDMRPSSISDRLKLIRSATDKPKFLRDYGIGAQILVDLGVRNIALLTNTGVSVPGLSGYSLNIASQRSLQENDH
jgi:3,4-dihydroxy 2-butanone 4-phosphate synthase/GTP cyclohydrolase II